MPLNPPILGMPMHHYGMMGFGWFYQLIILTIVFFIVWWILRSNKQPETAMEILNKRLAKGEITDQEYRKLKKEISE